MTISMNTNNVRFGKLRVREKSIEEVFGKQKVEWYRMARRDFKDGIDLLDRAGLDIDVRATESEHGKHLITQIIDKDRYHRFLTGGDGSKNPWDSLGHIITRALSLINFDTMTLKNEEAPYYAVYKADARRNADNSPSKRDILFYSRNKLSHRGRTHEVVRI